MRLTAIQINPIVGDLANNAAKIATMAKANPDTDLYVTSELALMAYPAKDLLLSNAFVAESWRIVRDLAVELKDYPPLLIGLAELNEDFPGRPLFNSAALLKDGEVHQIFRKTLLPTYDVFDDDRYFEPARGSQVLELNGMRIGVSICEDIWNDGDFWYPQRYHSDPIADLAAENVDLIVNLSASPFEIGKQLLRERMIGFSAEKYNVPIFYVNQVGANDDIVFDGRSCVFTASGKLIARAAGFAEDSLTVDMTTQTGEIADDNFSVESEMWRALVLGTRDYVHKSGFKSAVLGLSGGIDSALTAVIAAEALGPENVTGLLMPSPYSSDHSVADAQALADNLGINSWVLPIEPAMTAFDTILAEPFAGREADVTEENIQARIRGLTLMAMSNKTGALLLTTGNKSEYAVGYATLYGDMNGALAVIMDVLKMRVFALCEWYNAQRGADIIPRNTITKPPSAELRPGQVDQDSLPPYEILDEILAWHIERHESQAEIVARGFDKATVAKVLRLVRINEFKRKQAAPGIKVTRRAFGTGWRMPLVKRNWDTGVQTGEGVREADQKVLVN